MGVVMMLLEKEVPLEVSSFIKIIEGIRFEGGKKALEKYKMLIEVWGFILHGSSDLFIEDSEKKYEDFKEYSVHEHNISVVYVLHRIDDDILDHFYNSDNIKDEIIEKYKKARDSLIKNGVFKHKSNVRVIYSY